jgi:hypothetical protein
MGKRTSAVRTLLLLAAMAVLVGLGFPGRAFAGTLQVRDEAHVLASGDADRLRSQVASAPFDARLVFTSDYAEAEDLSRFVGSLIDTPNAIAVGIDPRHRHVQVHFGRGSGIARSEWPAIETAGNGEFRSGDWAGGAAAIFRTASQSVTGAPSSSVRPAPSSPGLGSAFVWILLIGGGIAALALFARSRSGYGVPPGGPGYGGGYGGGQYGGPYGGAPGGMGPVGGGVIGAGLGGLAGYEIGKLEGEREERDRGERDRGFDDDRSSDGGFDAGGGGSSWDGGDSGGGFGGGGDGGGGSDF